MATSDCCHYGLTGAPRLRDASERGATKNGFRFVQPRKLNHENWSKSAVKILALVAAITCCTFASVSPALAQTQSLTFMPATYDSGTDFGLLMPGCIISADVNGDGWPDLICANGSVNSLTVLTNNGSGDFGSNAVVNLASGAYWIVAADINGDGWPDLICADGNIPGTLTVLTNNGSGDFGSNATLAVGYGPMCVAAADVNGDGWPDLISADLYGKTLTIYTNNGRGLFGSNATLNVSTYPIFIMAADLKGDGKMDLICAEAYTNLLTVFTNNGSGDFGSNATYTVGSWPMSIAAADVNGDGKLDLITANYGAASGNTLTVLTNNGSGDFGSNATLVVGTGPESVVAADVNGDGWPDLISANSQVDTLTVLTNSGTGVFGSNATLMVNSDPLVVVSADVNGDGKPDLISGDHFNGLTVQTQVGFTAWTYATTNNSTSITVMDVNNDGSLDLVTADENYVKNNDDVGAGDTLTVLTNTGSGLFGYYATLAVGGEPDCVITADINRDGKLDLISANANSSGFGSLSMLTNNALGGFGLDQTLLVGEYGDPTCIVPLDIEGDGKVGLAGVVAGQLQLFTNNGGGVLSSNAALNVGSDLLWVTSADVNGDGKVDLICTHGNDPGNLTVLLNNGSGGFVSNATYEAGIAPQCVVAADINGDGWPDLITANTGSGTLTVLTNTGSGGFVSNATYIVGFQPRCVVAADINGDGWPDLIAATANVDEPTGNTLTILTNNGSGGFGSFATIAVDMSPNTVAAADVNGDGKPDLIVPCTDGTLTVLINTITFPTPTSTPILSMLFSGSDIVISWSSSATNFVVQTNSNLSSTNWGTAGYAISTSDGTNYSVTIPPPSGTLFYRLFRP
jgi:hypothetical protein